MVSFDSDQAHLAQTIRSLAIACREAGEWLRWPAKLVLVDNSVAGADAPRLQALLTGLAPQLGDALEASLLVAGSNLGYGRANNLAQAHADGGPSPDVVLVLNPDVDLAPDSLGQALAHLHRTPGAALIVPRASNVDGDDLWLAHRYPNPLLFAARGGLLARWRERLGPALDRYEIRDLPPDQAHRETICASGCFMLMPAAAWQAAGGFDERFFVYFEDYDLSTRLRALGTLEYRPDVRIRHLGGGAARKGGPHARLFLMSACRFFVKHGWFRQRNRAQAGPPGVLT
ncbi:MAG: glycosyltransferase [Burkholderiaceae bacterium]